MSTYGCVSRRLLTAARFLGSVPATNDRSVDLHVFRTDFLVWLSDHSNRELAVLARWELLIGGTNTPAEMFDDRDLSWLQRALDRIGITATLD
jgi:hypothetical protein